MACSAFSDTDVDVLVMKIQDMIREPVAVAQMIILPILQPWVEKVIDMPPTERGTNGYGSTDALGGPK